jgi:zinc transporter, ZIP family
MLEALLWGLVGSSSLVLGAVIGLRVAIGRRPLGLLMGFGAGTLISAVSFELADEALKEGGTVALGVGLAVGALAFWLGDRFVEGLGGEGRPQRPRGADAEGSGAALVLGALLDGVPEQAAIGLSLASGASGGVGVALVAAIFISNVPESLASAAAMRAARRSRRQVLALWLGVAVLTTLATLAGYGLLGGASGTVTGAVQALAAGAILVMLVDAMVPEAVRHGGKTVGLVTVLGFAVAVLISEA